MWPDWEKTFTMEVDKSVFDKLAQKEAVWKNEFESLGDHPDVTAQPGLKPRRDL